MSYRTIGTIIICISILLLPYWIYLPLLWAGVIFFPFYWEGIVLALLSEALFGAGGRELSEFFYSYGFITLALAIAIAPLRERIRVNV